jgi:methyl-accepting chemotaxis protein
MPNPLRVRRRLARPAAPEFLMKPEERKKVWIHTYQTRILLRVGCYWLIYLVALWNLLFVWRMLAEGPGDLLAQYSRFVQDYYPPLVLFIVLLPVAAWDAMKFAHRVVGPLVRVRQTLQEMAAGKSVRPVRFRDGDSLGELRDDFNAMLEALQRRGFPVLKPADPDQADSQRQGA